MAIGDIDQDAYTKNLLLTKKYHREIYPAVDPKNPKISAAGKTVLVTGASHGIGASIGPVFAQAGASGIAICAPEQSELEPIAEAIKKARPESDVLAIGCDLTESAQTEAMFSQIKDKFGSLDIVVANAGGYHQGPGFPKLGELDPEIWCKDFDVNLKTAYLTAYHYINTFGEDDVDGTFINLNSTTATMMFPGLSSHGTANYALIRLAEVLDLEYSNLKSFSLNPGITKGISGLPAYEPFAFDAPELVGAFTVWLSSGRADKFRGGYLHVNWDVEELEAHADEIKKKGLLKTKFLNGILGPNGYQWES